MTDLKTKVSLLNPACRLTCWKYTLFCLGFFVTLMKPSTLVAQSGLFNPNPEQPWTGIYVGAAAGLSSREFSVSTTAPRASSFGTSLHLLGFTGAQIQRGNVVFGLEANMATVPASQRMRVVFAPNDIVTARSGGGTLVTGRLRVGYAFGRVLLHASAGLGLLSTRLSVTDGVSSATTHLDKPAWSLAVGADYAMTQNLFLRMSLTTAGVMSSNLDVGGLGVTSTRHVENAATVGVGVLF
jgi:opacity protein-like surface antigen